MELTPARQRMIEAHLAESQARMAEHAFELNDLVRFALSASKAHAAGEHATKGQGRKVYYPMDPVNDCIRQWDGLARKLEKLVASVERDRTRLGVPPFDAESPAELPADSPADSPTESDPPGDGAD